MTVSSLNEREEDPSKDKSDSQSILTFKRAQVKKVLGVRRRTFKRSFFSRGDDGLKTKREKNVLQTMHDSD